MPVGNGTEYVMSIKLGAEVSLVVYLIDDYTGRGASDEKTVPVLEVWHKKPVRKPDGGFVFTGLPGGEHRLTVRSEIYLDEEMTVRMGELDPGNPVVYLTLKPRPSYPFPGGATLVRTAVRGPGGLPAPHAEVCGTVLSESCARARLVRMDTGERKEIFLTGAGGGIPPGSEFLLKEKGEEKSEYIKLAGPSRKEQGFRLEKPLTNDYRPGALLLPVVRTRADHRGEAVIYSRGMRSRTCDMKLDFAAGGASLIREARLEEGKTFYLGTIQMFA